MLLWLTVGRALLGSIGWLIFLFFIYPFPLAIPTVFIILFIILAKNIKPISKSKTGSILTRGDKASLYSLYISVFLFGFFLVDFGDVPNTSVSVATVIFGRDFINLSGTFSLVFFFLSLALYIYSIIKLFISNRKYSLPLVGSSVLSLPKVDKT